MNKKITALVLTVCMLLASAGVCTFAEETNYFYADFNSCTPGQTIGETTNNNGATTSQSTWFRYPSENGGANVLDVTRNLSKTTATVVERNYGNNAIKLETPAKHDDDYVFMYQVNQSFPTNGAVHIGFDMKTDSLPGGGRVRIKTNPYGYDYTFMQFTSDKSFKFKGKTIGRWTDGKWYDVDIYNTLSDNMWYLFINGKLEMKFKDSTYNLSSFVGVWIEAYGTSEEVMSNFWLDNLCICHTTSALSDNAVNVGAYEYIEFTNENLSIDTGSSKYYDATDSVNLSYPGYVEGSDVIYEYSGGIFGKAENDKSLHIYAEISEDAADFGFAEYQIGEATGENSKIHYTMLLAKQDASSEVEVKAVLPDNEYSLFKTSPDSGMPESFGTPLEISLAENAWNRLDLVFTIGNEALAHTVEIFVNGKKASADAFEIEGSTQSLKIRISNCSSNGFYLDDIACATYTDGNFEFPEVELSSSEVTVYPDRIENIGSLTVGEFIDSLQCNREFYVADASGNRVNDLTLAAKGKTVVIAFEAGGDILLPVYDIMLPDDYYEPSGSIVSPAGESEFVWGVHKSCEIELVADAYDSVESVGIYMDGNLIFEDSSEPYGCVWEIPNIPGDHILYAIITDSYGTNAHTEGVAIKIISNQTPDVEFVTQNPSNSLTFGEKLDLTVVSSDSDGRVIRTDVFINNVLHDSFTSESKDYSLEFEDYGRYTLRAVAYDNYNVPGEAQITVNVVHKSTTVVGNIDFESYTAGTSFTNSSAIPNADFSGNAITFNGDMGKKEIAADGTNQFLKCGVSESNAGGSATPYVAAEYFVANAVVEYETDIIFSRNDVNHNTNCRGEDKNGNAIHMWAFTFANTGEVKVYNGGANVSVGTYKPNTWYRLKIKLDIPNGRYDFYLENLSDESDKCEAVDFKFTDNKFYKLQHIRIVGPFTSDVPGYIGYDNVLMQYTSDYPGVKSVSDNLGTLGYVDSTAQYVIVEMTEAVGEITANDIALENDYGKVSVKEVKSEGEKIVITPKDGFKSSSRYKLTLKSSAKLVNGNTFGFDTVSYFEAGASSFDVRSGEIAANKSDVSFTADIVNTTGKIKKVTLVATAYDNGILKKVYSKAFDVSASGEIRADFEIGEAYSSIKAFVITDWATGAPLSAKIFSFNK